MQQRKKTYTKKDLVRRIAHERKQNLQQTSVLVDQVFTALREIMMSADPDLRIEIRDFGVLEVKPTKCKMKARNPRSGQVVVVPSRRKTHFKPGKLLKSFLSAPLEENSIRS